MGAAIMMVYLLVASIPAFSILPPKRVLVDLEKWFTTCRLTKETEDNFQRLSQKSASRHNSTIVNIHSVEFFPPARL
jgi:hypothetical protein